MYVEVKFMFTFLAAKHNIPPCKKMMRRSVNVSISLSLYELDDEMNFGG